MTCENCKFAQRNTRRIDALDRALVCPKLQDVSNLWFAPQVPDTFGCNLYEPKEAKPTTPGWMGDYGGPGCDPVDVG